MSRPTEYNFEYLHEKMVDYLTKETGEKWVTKTRPEAQRVRIVEDDDEADNDKGKREYWKNEILKYINRNNELFMALGGELFVKTLKKIEKIEIKDVK